MEQGFRDISLLVSNFISLADKALFVLFTHVRVYFIIAEEALPAELAQWMNAAFNLVLRGGCAVLPLHRREMGWQNICRV